MTPVGAHVGEAVGVVGLGADRLGHVAADLAGVDVEGGGDLDVADVIAAELDVHQPGDRLVRRSCRDSSVRPWTREDAQFPTPKFRRAPLWNSCNVFSPRNKPKL